MKLETFFEKFDQFADAPDAVAKMRELVLQLAVRGNLTERIHREQSYVQIDLAEALRLPLVGNAYSPTRKIFHSQPENWDAGRGRRQHGHDQRQGLQTRGSGRPKGNIDYHGFRTLTTRMPLSTLQR